jgi:hypothetical protein
LCHIIAAAGTSNGSRTRDPRQMCGPFPFFAILVSRRERTRQMPVPESPLINTGEFGHSRSTMNGRVNRF